MKTNYPYIVTKKGANTNSFLLAGLKEGHICIIKEHSDGAWIYRWPDLDNPFECAYPEDIAGGSIVDFDTATILDFSNTEKALDYYNKAVKAYNEIYNQEMTDSMLECVDQEMGLYGDVENDLVKKPNHYQIFPEHNLEIKDINKRILDRIEDSGFNMTLYEAGWWQQSQQYFQRFYAKNGLEDLKKGVETMQFVIDSMEERKNGK